MHTWRGLSANLRCRSETCCSGLAANTGCKKSSKNRHLGTIPQLCRAVSSQLRHISIIGKKWLTTNISPTCSHNVVDVSPLTAEICWRDLGIPANFNGFRVLVSLLHRNRSAEVSKTLPDVWPSPGLVHYIYTLGVLPPNGILPAAKFTLRPSLVLSYIGSDTAWHSSSGRCDVVHGMELRNFRRRRHLYSVGRPSRRALAHILVASLKQYLLIYLLAL